VQSHSYNFYLLLDLGRLQTNWKCHFSFCTFYESMCTKFRRIKNFCFWKSATNKCFLFTFLKLVNKEWSKTVKQYLLNSFKNFLVSKNKMTIFLRQEKCIANTNFIWFIIERTEVSFARKCTRYACRIIQLIEFFCLWQTFGIEGKIQFKVRNVISNKQHFS